jgi:hypothetical protein
VIEKHRARAGRTLIEREDVLRHRVLPCFISV